MDGRIHAWPERGALLDLLSRGRLCQDLSWASRSEVPMVTVLGKVKDCSLPQTSCREPAVLARGGAGGPARPPTPTPKTGHVLTSPPHSLAPSPSPGEFQGTDASQDVRKGPGGGDPLTPDAPSQEQGRCLPLPSQVASAARGSSGRRKVMPLPRCV